MENIRTRYLKLVFGIIGLFLVSCTDELILSDIELAFEKLEGSWDMSQGGSIIIDGINATPNFEGFGVSFTDGGYQTTNAGDLFRASGTWQWEDETAQRILVDDRKQVTIIRLTEEEFVFSFTFSGTGGIANGIAGSYTISLNQ